MAQVLDRKGTQRVNLESAMQIASVTWFRATYPHLELLLFSTANGGFRFKSVAEKMKEEGMLPGASDLLFLYPSGRWHGLGIEFKLPGRRPSPEQLEFGSAIMGAGYLFRVVYSEANFRELITNYLNSK